jgi:hypothetical protein
MKRTFAEITTAQEFLPNTYDPILKRRKLDDQKIGDFIVKALDSFHFKIVTSIGEVNADSGSFFAPKFLYWMFGEEERIRGYQNLSVSIYLSAKRLVPYIEIDYSEKAPAWAKTDDLKEKLLKHYGIFLSKSEFEAELDEEKAMEMPGDTLCKFENGRIVRHICLSDDTFTSMNLYVQALLPFFIEAATPIEPCPYWKYFLVFSPEGALIGLFTVFEAHQTAVKFRLKIS